MELKGERVILRNWRQSDAKELHRIVNDRTIAGFTRVPHPHRMKHSADFIKKARSDLRKKKAFAFAVILRESNVLAGSIDLKDIDRHNSKAEIGYLLGKEYRGKGYMAEALQLVLAFGFDRLKLNRIRISCGTKNKASRKVIERTGAKFEGIEREAIRSGLGKLHDLRVYSILKREFKRKDIAAQ